MFGAENTKTKKDTVLALKEGIVLKITNYPRSGNATGAKQKYMQVKQEEGMIDTVSGNQKEHHRGCDINKVLKNK